MNERRTILRRLAMIGAALAATGAGVAAAEDAAPKPVGLTKRILDYIKVVENRLLELIEQQKRRLDRLTRRVANLEQTTEEEVTQLRILNRENPDEPLRILFGPTDDCTIGIDPVGPTGLLLSDRSGVRLLPQTLDDSGLSLAADEASGFPPTLFFGPTDECRILVAEPGQEPLDPRMIIEDPFGLLVRSPFEGDGGSLQIGAPECRIRAGAMSDNEFGGMAFTDPMGFLFESPAFQSSIDDQQPPTVRVEGALVADTLIETSSGEFKENVRPIDDALAKIKSLQGVYFDWTAEKGGQAGVGFIGEAVEGVLPQVVATREGETGVMGVAYGNVVAVAVEGIKAQQTELERLQQANDDLQVEVQALRERLEAMSQRIDGASLKS